MSKATLFYLPYFKTGYPNSKLFTYLSGTDTPYPVYKDTTGLEHTNPVIMDNKGENIIYIDADVEYRYVLVDENDVVIYDMDNIAQLNGEPGPKTTIKGETGAKGKRGDQGQSGDPGPKGFTGDKGDKGLDYLNRIEVSTSGDYIIPIGTEYVYITASAGGGAGASWSNYFFVIKYKDDKRSQYSVKPQAKREGETSALTTTNSLYFDYVKYQSFVFFPGSGFSGQSKYRYRVELNKDIENTINVSIGGGGKLIDGSLNGGNGGNTIISVNGNQVLFLQGGIGGENKFPINSSNVPLIPIDGKPIQLNRGFENGMAIFQHSTNTTLSITTPTANQANFSYNTYYKQKHSTLGYIEKGVAVSVWIPFISVAKNTMTGKGYYTNELKQSYGDNNIFGNNFSYYSIQNNSTTTTAISLKTAIKTGINNTGWGAGGAISYMIRMYNSVPSDIMKGMIPGQSLNSSTFVDLTKTDVKNSIRNYMRNFTLSDSFEPGVTEIPEIDDQTGVWNIYDTVRASYEANTSYMMYKGVGFYENLNTVWATTRDDCKGGEGVPGFAIIEFGSIFEH